jgi:hypothetical protein
MPELGKGVTGVSRRAAPRDTGMGSGTPAARRNASSAEERERPG